VNGTVYRAATRNAHGDAVDGNGDVVRPVGNADVLVGTITGIIMGGQSVTPSRGRQESSDTTGQIGCPTTEPVTLQFGDRIDIRDVRYKVTSRPEWDYPNSLTGTLPTHYWVWVEATI
jgi:hypothetical protein